MADQRAVPRLMARVRSMGGLTILSAVLLFLVVAASALTFPKQLERAAEFPSIDTVHILATAMGFGVSPKLPITLIKVDERSFEAWGRPFPMAKSRLAELIEVVRPLKPTAILVDFDFSISRSAWDTFAFNRLLASWSPDDPPLLLPAELRVSDDDQIMLTPSVLSVPASQAPVFWTSVLFRKDADHKVREWRLWEYSCDPLEIVLSPQLIVNSVTRGGLTEVERVRQGLTGNSGCPASDGDLPTGDMPDWLLNTVVLSPINYVFGRTSQPYNDVSGRPMLSEWPAVDVLEKGLSAAAVTDRTVIIGASRADGGDNHLTPIGSMEGMRIIANAVATGPSVFGIRAPSKFESFLLPLLLTGVGVVLLKWLKLVFFGLAMLLVTTSFYALIASVYGPATAINAIALGIALAALFFVFESILQFIYELIVERRGWRALVNKE